MTTWRITAIINIPLALVEDVPSASDSPFPEKLKSTSRIPGIIAKEINGVHVALEPYRGPTISPEFLPYFNEPAVLTIVADADTPENALLEYEDLLERITDDLSLQLQYAVYILGLEVLDVTPPLTIGMTRRTLLYPLGSGYNSPKFLQSNPLSNELISTTLELKFGYEINDEKVRAALRWYVKGIAAPFEMDKFAFYWIALEILCKHSDISVEKPYRARCQHEIPYCHFCGQTTANKVQGLTIQQFLIERNNIDALTAKELWEMRQMFHGANHLSTKATKELPRLTLILRYAALHSLKEALDIAQDAPPAVTLGGPAINRRWAMGGSREIVEYDL